MSTTTTRARAYVALMFDPTTCRWEDITPPSIVDSDKENNSNKEQDNEAEDK